MRRSSGEGVLVLSFKDCLTKVVSGGGVDFRAGKSSLGRRLVLSFTVYFGCAGSLLLRELFSSWGSKWGLFCCSPGFSW